MGKTTGSDRKYLRQLAHPLKPLVQIGASGVTEALITAVDTALSDHELIKIRFLDYKGEKKELAGQIAEKMGADIAGVIGHVAILYREAEDEEKRKIGLPSTQRVKS
jgi:RNA-binding protein